MKVLGFWAKLFTKCVAVEEYQTLSDTVEELNKNVVLKEKVISDLKDVVSSKEERIAKLIRDVNGAMDELNNTTTKYDGVVKELSNEKDKQEVTLKILSDAQSEINVLTKQLESVPVLVEDCDCKETTAGDVTEDNSSKEETTTGVPTSDEEFAEDTTSNDDKIGDGRFEKEDVLKGADAVVTTSDKLQNFINSLSRIEMRELKDDILKGHSNDKRLTTTLKNWGKKFPGKLETEVYFMFKTALTRRRGKQHLSAWYNKYDNM